MLIKVTNYCSMGCSHCMENSTVAGEHMTRETFTRALNLTARLEEFAWDDGCWPIILLSGGECTEHPDIVGLIEEVWRRGWTAFLISNGMWLGNPALRSQILDHPQRTPRNLFIQITNDARFYPTAPPRWSDPAIGYVESLSLLLPLGRAKVERAQGLPVRRGPTSFNFRSATISLGDVRWAIKELRKRAAMGLSGHCTPSITSTGALVAGESGLCMQVGDVFSTPTEVTRAVISMGSCNRCGLETDLPQELRVAIGLSQIHAP